jgi:hypothetical protein
MWSGFLQLFGIVCTVLLAVVTWAVTNFFAKPLLRFFELREKTHEALFFYANVGGSDSNGFEEAVRELRRLASQLSALDISLKTVREMRPASWWLRRRGYNIENASQSLTGFSNTLDSRKGERAINRDKLEKALLLPLSYTDEQIAQTIVLLGRDEP